MSKLAVFWNNIFFDKKGNEFLSNEERQNLLYFYLIEQRLNNPKYNEFFTGIESKDLDIIFLPDNIITSEEMIVNPEIWNEYKALFVLAELDWNFHKPTDAYGIKFIQLLRLNNVFVPIFCSSLLQKEFLYDIPTSTIIQTVGHQYLELPYSNSLEDNYFDIKVLENEDLYICQQLFCRKRGLISELTHSLESNISGAENKTKKARDIVQKLILLEGEKNNFKLQEFNDKFPNVNNKNIKDVRNFIENFGNEIDSKIVSENTNSKLTISPIEKYEILWLDDELDDQNLIYKKFIAFEKITKVHIASTVNDALKILNEDSKKNRPQIMVAIVDYKLTYKDKNGIEKYQTKQGYEFIKTIAKSNIIIKLLAYSSMPRNLQLWLSESYGINITSIPKKAIDISSPNGINYIVEEVIRLGNENWNILNNLPDTGGWKNLKSSYIQLITHPNYDTYERKIAEKANKWIERFLNKQPNKPINISSSTFRPITNQVIVKKDLDLIFNYLKNITHDFTHSPDSYINTLSIIERDKIKKSKKIIYHALKVLKINSNNYVEKENQFFEAKSLSENNIEHAINYFSARRICIWLRNFNKDYTLNNIATLIKGCEQSDGKSKNIINTSLGLSLSKFPNHITIEELRWCQKDQYEYFSGLYDFMEDVEYNKKSINNVIKKSSILINQFLKKYLKDVSSLKTQYNKRNFTFNLSNRLEVKVIDEIKAILKHINSTIFINPINNAEITKLIPEYKEKLSEFIQLLLEIKKLTASKSITEIKSFNFFIDNLCNPQNDKNKNNILLKFYKRVDFKNTNRFQEYIHLFEPWLLLKKKGKTYSKDDEIKLRINCDATLKGNYDKKLFQYKEINNIKYYYKPYHYIKEAKKNILRSNDFKYLSNDIVNNLSIWVGYISWRKEIKILWDYLYSYPSKIHHINFEESERKIIKKELFSANDYLGKPFEDEFELFHSYEDFSNIDEEY